MAKIYGQLEKAQIENLASDPVGVGLSRGRLWYNTAVGQFKYYDGSAVQVVTSLGTSADAIGVAMTATGADAIGTSMTSTGANAVAGDVTSTGANAIASVMTSTGANSIGSTMTSTGANAILATSTLWPSPTTSIANSIGSAMTSTGANAVANTRTRTSASDVSVGGVAISGSSGAYTTTSTTYQDIPNVNVQIDTTGRPVRLCLIPDGSGNLSYLGVARNSSVANCAFRITRSISPGAHSLIAGPCYLSSAPGAAAAVTINVPPGVFEFIDVVASANDYNYQLQVAVLTGTNSETAYVQYVKMVAYEL